MLVKSEISTTLDGLSLKITPHCWLFTSNLNVQPHPWIYIYTYICTPYINIYIYNLFLRDHLDYDCSFPPVVFILLWHKVNETQKWIRYFTIAGWIAPLCIPMSCLLLVHSYLYRVCLFDGLMPIFFLDNPFCRFYRHFCCCRTPVSTGEVRTLAGSSGFYRKYCSLISHLNWPLNPKFASCNQFYGINDSRV